MNKPEILIIGAGINGLVAANYLRRAGCRVTMTERAQRVGGACVSEVATVNGVRRQYALGASVLGLMQDFVFEETGLASRLPTFVPEHAKLVFFPGDNEPAWIHRNAAELDRELANKWGEKGDVAAFRADEAKVVSFLQDGYVHATPPYSEQPYQALRRRGVTTLLVVYPGEHHGGWTTAHQKDFLERRLAWYDQHVKGETFDSANEHSDE